MKPQLPSYLPLPEGPWRLAAERRASTQFAAEARVALAVAMLGPGGGELAGRYLVANVLHMLYVYPQPSPPSAASAAGPGGSNWLAEAARGVDFRPLGEAGKAAAYPTAAAHTGDSLDEMDLLVGTSTGEVVVLSLEAQLQAPANNFKPVNPLSFNTGGATNPSRCVSVAWVPGSNATSFVVAHRDGGIYQYHKLTASSSEPRLLARSGSQSGMLSSSLTRLQCPGTGGGVNAAALSPDGSHLAAACKDGRLRIYDLRSKALVAGCKSYYGGLHCCAWSPDGRYVATGGEDDLVAMYGLAERCVVACGEGHSSWVSTVAFDPWACQLAQEGAAPVSPLRRSSGSAVPAAAPPPESVYRLASGGQDCRVLVWEVAVSEDSVVAAQLASPSRLPPQSGGSGSFGLPPLPPSPGKLMRSRSSSPTKQRAAAAEVARWRSLDPQLQGSSAFAAEEAVIEPAMRRTDLPLVTPTAQLRAHWEPVCSLVFAQAGMLTACHGSSIKLWARPPPPTPVVQGSTEPEATLGSPARHQQL